VSEPLTASLDLYRGDTFNRNIAWTAGGVPVNMTGGSLLAQIKGTRDYSAALIVAFTINNFVPSAGTFSLHLDASTFATVTTWQSAQYDVQYTDASGNVQTLLSGEFDLNYDVSR
jgi:hypothetical protein